MRSSDIDGEELVDLHTEQWNHLENPSHPDFGKKHHYFVQFSDECGSACHVKAHEVLGTLDYTVLTPTIGQTFVTHEQMKSISNDPNHKVLAFTPATIATKVSPEAGARCAEFNERKMRSKLREETDNEGEQRYIGNDVIEDNWFASTQIWHFISKLHLCLVGCL